jgi:hypothetical protein
MRWRRERQQRIAEARESIERSRRLAPLIDTLRAEALGVGAWAHRRFEANHLTELFHRGRSS